MTNNILKKKQYPSAFWHMFHIEISHPTFVFSPPVSGRSTEKNSWAEDPDSRVGGFEWSDLPTSIDGHLPMTPSLPKATRPPRNKRALYNRWLYHHFPLLRPYFLRVHLKFLLKRLISRLSLVSASDNESYTNIYIYKNISGTWNICL